MCPSLTQLTREPGPGLFFFSHPQSILPPPKANKNHPLPQKPGCWIGGDVRSQFNPQFGLRRLWVSLRLSQPHPSGIKRLVYGGANFAPTLADPPLLPVTTSFGGSQGPEAIFGHFFAFFTTPGLSKFHFSNLSPILILKPPSTASTPEAGIALNQLIPSVRESFCPGIFLCGFS